jgi:hypothetical protein
MNDAKVAEPLVRHLVHDDRGQALALGGSHGFLVQEAAFRKRDGGGVFHGAVQEVRHQQLVVLAELVRHAEILIEEFQALCRVGEPVLGRHLGRHRLPRKQAHRVRTAVVFPYLVRTGVHGEVVRAEFFGAREGPLFGARDILDAALAHGGRHHPVSWRGHGDLVRAFQIGLIEQREHLVGSGGFEVRIRVHPAIDRIDHAVQAFAIGAVQAFVGNRYAVAAGLQVRCSDGDEPLVVLRRDGLAVDRHAGNFCLVEVDGQRLVGVFQVEFQRGDAGKAFLACQRELQRVVDVGNAGRAGHRVFLRQEGVFGARSGRGGKRWLCGAKGQQQCGGDQVFFHGG